MNNEHSLMAASAIEHQAVSCFQGIFQVATLPSILYRPSLSIDGDQWCALYGKNLQEGVSGFGDSPVNAMAEFDKNWYAKLGGQGS